MLGLHNKRILLGVGGGIAAYKSPELVRMLRQAGAEVQLVLTAAAAEFVTALTLQAVSGHPVRSASFDPEAEAGMDHISLARWADAIVIAPATADLLARLAAGQANDLLSTLVLASRAQRLLCPAMNSTMWQQQSTQQSWQNLRSQGWASVGPEAGDLACGEVGVGRLAEPERICAALARLFQPGSLEGVRVAISAGPSREFLDPVRYISNASSGKMGYALARAAVEAGAQTTLLSGPCALPQPERLHEFVAFVSAAELDAALQERQPQLDVFIACAAVSDYRAQQSAPAKLAKREALDLRLTATEDCVANFSSRRRPGQLVVGFAAQSENLAAEARAKLERKRLDLICANLIGVPGQGFDSEDNELLLLYPDGNQRQLARAHKEQIARELIAAVAQLWRESE